MSVTYLIDFIMKNQENMISGESELFSENKKLNENLTVIQKKN